MSAQIESVMNEERLFPPPEAFARQANISGLEQYKALCAEAEKDHAGFWGRLARENLNWIKPFTRALDDSNPPFLGPIHAVFSRGSEPVANGSGSGSTRFGTGSVPVNPLCGHPYP